MKSRKIAAGVAAWEAYAERNKAVIVDPGSPIGKTKRVGLARVTAYTVVRAESHEAAARLFEPSPLHDLSR